MMKARLTMTKTLKVFLVLRSSKVFPLMKTSKVFPSMKALIAELASTLTLATTRSTETSKAFLVLRIGMATT